MFATRFKLERKRLNLTQEEIAKKLDISRSNVANWENGLNMASSELIIKSAKLFHCSTDYLLGKSNYRNIGEEFDAKYKNELPKLKSEIKKLNSLTLHLDNAHIIDVIEENSPDTIQIPVLGRIPAGMPFEAIEEQYSISSVIIPKEWLKGGKEYFALRLDGDSMEPEYHDKDIVVFLKTSNCESGQDCCIRINGFDATFKKVKKQENGIMIIPLNENNSTGFNTTFYTKEQVETMPIEILGIVKKVERYK